MHLISLLLRTWRLHKDKRYTPFRRLRIPTNLAQVKARNELYDFLILCPEEEELNEGQLWNLVHQLCEVLWHASPSIKVKWACPTDIGLFFSCLLPDGTFKDANTFTRVLASWQYFFRSTYVHVVRLGGLGKAYEYIEMDVDEDWDLDEMDCDKNVEGQTKDPVNYTDNDVDDDSDSPDNIIEGADTGNDNYVDHLMKDHPNGDPLLWCVTC
jgi:hypothetical protein